MGRRWAKRRRPAPDDAPKVERAESQPLRGSATRDELIELIDQGKEAEALGLINRVWPKPGYGLQRLETLLELWPARAATELAKAPPEERDRPEVARALARRVLSLDDEVLDALEGIEAPWAEEVGLIRAASRAIGQGRDEEGREILRRVGLRSPFRQVRLFLRGLSAFYRGDDEEAARAWSRIDEDQIEAPLVRTLSLALDAPARPDNEGGKGGGSRLGSEILQAFGLGHVQPRLRLLEIYRLIASGRVNTALRAASRLGPDTAPHDFEGVRRDLASALLSSGLDISQVQIRLARALPPDEQDPDNARLMALVHEAENRWESAHELWMDVLLRMSRRKGVDEGYPTSWAIAAVIHHFGQIFQTMAQNDEDAHRSTSPFFSRRRYRSEYWETAYDQLNHALQIDFSNIKIWRTMIEVAGRLSDRREKARVLERFIKQFPDRPESLIAAAEEAAGRKAFDKGLRFARRAIELEPMSRPARTLEAALLRGKALKKLRGGDLKTARELLHQAAGVPHLPRSVSFETLAEAAAINLIQGEDEQARRFEREVLGTMGRPWSWSKHLLLALARLSQPPSRGRRRPQKMPHFALPPIDPPEETPTAEEVAEILSIDNESYASFEDELKSMLVRLINQAAERGGHLLRGPEDLLRALRWSREPEAKLRIAERGCEQAPKEPFFLIVRYETALELEHPPEAFATAEAELNKASDFLKQRLREVDNNFMELELSLEIRRYIRRCDHLRDRLRAHLRTKSGSTQKPKRKNGKQGDLPF